MEHNLLFNLKNKVQSFYFVWLMLMLLAVWSIFIQNGDINRDGLLYLKQSYLISEGQWREAFKLYPWPFFSFLIAILHKISGLDLQSSGHAIGLIFFGITIYFYLKILTLISNKKFIIVFGALLLTSLTSIMDDYVGMILRDHGFWAGLMAATYFYFYAKSQKNFSLYLNILWQACFLFASLFRIEALIFLAFVPVWQILKDNFKNRQWYWKSYFFDNFVLICLFIVGGLTLLFNVSLVSSTRLPELYVKPLGMLNNFSEPNFLFSNHYYLNQLLQDYSLLALVGLLLLITAFKWIKGLGFLHLTLLASSWLLKRNKFLFRHDLLFFIYLSAFIVFINFCTHFVLSNRYWVFHWWWLLLFIAGSSEMISKKISKKIIFLIYLILVIFSLNVVIDSSKKSFDRRVTDYLIERHDIETIDFVNLERIKYYYYQNIVNLFTERSSNAQHILVKLTEGDKLPSGYHVVKSFQNRSENVILLRRNEN